MKPFFDFLIKKFVKDHKNVNSQDVRQAYGKLGGTVGIIINSTILILELIVGLFLNSIAVTADAFHNLTDAISSLVTIISFKIVNRPADDKHPFGYGRVEYLTALLFAGAILVVGYEFLRNSVVRIMHPVTVPFNKISFICMLFALPLQITLNRFTNYLGNTIDSSALKASALESFTDILVLAMVIFSLLVTRFTTFPIDGYVAFIVSLFILHSGIELGKEMVDTLLGKAPSEEFVEELKSSVLSYPYITGVHDLVIHNYGPGRYITSLHAEVPCDVSVMEIHDVIDKAEKEIGSKMNMYLSIHMDPIKIDSPDVRELKETVSKEIAQITGVLSMHDFRVVGNDENKTLIFDVVLDKACFNDEKKELISEQIKGIISNLCSSYRSIVTFDREFY
ncbi:cation diffusion facilitator family transporter [Clostridium sp. YIM B02515]|uniref:Cation diffusion facilitator family transporter n=1 Tax=Clostridium rhizosphaerae TaxID=2803861 RepID=A0ABS1TDT8_9CLOT|nr:cation diffusion facilitator family transporter [Clostridium rhizosphaerae]MBL4937533.1 cation diffusion facilitator family transporter [Clostridium rhizosphaerae]